MDPNSKESHTGAISTIRDRSARVCSVISNPSTGTDFVEAADCGCAARTTYRTRAQAQAEVFDYIERFYNPRRRHSTWGYLSPMEFEMNAGFA